MDDKKQCRKCKEVKSYKDFHKNRTKKDGYQDRCVACRSTAVIDTEVIKGTNKRCTLCNVVKHLDEFHNDRGSKVARCKTCCAAYLKTWYDKNFPERPRSRPYPDDYLIVEGETKRCSVCKQVKAFEDFNNLTLSLDGKNSRCRSCTTDYVRANKELYRQLNKEWSARNKDKVTERSVKRRLSKINAKIPCLTDNDLNWIAQIYKQRDILQKYTGDIYNVDHAIPIQGADVCGLHVPWNLTVMHQSENARKKNKVFTWEWLALTPWNEHIWLELQKEKYKE